MNQDSLKAHLTGGDNPQQFLAGELIITDQMTAERMRVVCDNLEMVLGQNVPGDIVEFGCYAGTTSLFIRRLLDTYHQSDTRRFHVYDSFEGLPEKGRQDMAAGGEDFQAGKLSVSKNDFIRQFKAASLRLPVIHKGWFSELPAESVPGTIAFAFLDGDFYHSIIDSLRLVWPRLSEQGILLIDDYKNPKLPGVEQAVNDFFRSKDIRLAHHHDIAVIQKKNSPDNEGV